MRKIYAGTQEIYYLVMPDADTIHNPDLIKQNKFIQIDLGTGKITDLIKFNNGNLCMPGGANQDSIGVITRAKEK